ncbi:MAG: geranylgeranylglycerol-phosphate geranylgeranyltransferase [Bacteroidetes bacterium]|nr:geranylgeranylglycerol-phosphate geranylgeranyltransferase [Bacteroidota bacterium]
MNLLIICIALLLARYTIIKPILGFEGATSSLSDALYLIIVLSTLFIAAGGYIINDYFDTGIDKINKPDKNLIGVKITRKSALLVYVFMTLAGLAGSFWFGHVADTRYAGLIFVLCAGLLYFYSASYKKMFLVGNLTISLLTALTIGLSILFDKNAWSSEPIYTLIIAYSLFAFTLTLVREIIKDCEDAQGDMAYHSSTLPIVTGLKTARWTASLLCILTFAAILAIQIAQVQWEDKISFLYVTIAIQLPLLFLAFRNIKAKTKNDDHANSIISKIIMVTGLFSMLIFYISF